MTKRKPKCPYTFPHRSRKAKVEYLTSIGGYSGGRGYWSSPLEFNVSLASANLDFEYLFDTYYPQFCSSKRKADRMEMKWKVALQYGELKGSLYENARERIVDSLNYDDTYRTLYSGEEVDVTLELCGRGEKHLCIIEFEGVRLPGSDSDFEEMLTGQVSDTGREDHHGYRLRKGYEWGISDATIDRLYRYVRQCEIDFTPEKASAELEYQAADILFGNAELAN